MTLEQTGSRSELIEKIVSAAFDAAHGVQSLDEQKLMQTLGALVKSKLLSAEDSFALREQLLDTNRFDSFIEQRIQSILENRNQTIH